MRPVKLVMSAFGSYAGEETVDFSGMESGIFLVTGDTGAGKTTIFDGIVYALYDRTSGGVRDGNMMRSAYADLRTPTFVDFTFSCRGEQYRIVRNPDYERESLRKDKEGNPKKTQEKSRVEFYLPDGSLLRGNKRECNNKIRELIGLDAEQFMQVAMIAQGDFLKLLHAKSEERREIFSRIFDTGIYGRIQKGLREQERESYGKLKDKEKAVKEQAGRILFCENWEGKERLEEAKEQGNLETLLELLENLGRLQGEQTEVLKKEKDEIKNLTDQTEKMAETARAILNLREKKEKLDQWLLENGSREEQLQEALEKNTGLLEEKTAQMQEQRLVSEKERQSFEEKEKSLKERLSQMEGLKTLWADAISAMKQQKAAGSDWEEANRKYQESRQEYEEMYDAFLREQAGILADSLENGKPCPVCGSTVHPAKARLSAEAPSQAQVEKGKKACGEAEAARDRAQRLFQKKAQSYQGALGCLNQEGKRLLGEGFDAKETDWKEKAAGAMNKAKEELEVCRSSYDLRKKEQSQQEISLSREIKEAKKAADLARNNLEAFIRQEAQTKGEQKAAREQEAELLEKWKENVPPEEAAKKAEEELIILRNKVREMENSYSEAYNRYQSNLQTEELLKKYEKEYETLKKDYEIIRHLSQTACGSLSGTAKIDFESYIQRRYFEKIIHRANQRLMQMSLGQFLLKCRDMSQLGGQGKVGLDLDIYSLVTESTRDVKTLSGGESFMAALSMALGLADVIQDSAGAIRLDTLFIDEGFGSLDENAREQAIRVLYDLAGERRLIGIISHVTELKEQIEPKLSVTKTKKGSHVVWIK
ncbi:AAA family ATPase [Ruminococcus sp. 5_1_39BFAA]|uniref:AAA family ATPase n=1 Tax=Ruminococcus sp. 5_1_39BFAA TaxID=457412 RepID=UPI00356A5FA4